MLYIYYVRCVLDINKRIYVLRVVQCVLSFNRTRKCVEDVTSLIILLGSVIETLDTYVALNVLSVGFASLLLIWIPKLWKSILKSLH